MKYLFVLVFSVCVSTLIRAEERYTLTLLKSGTARHAGEFNEFSAVVKDLSGHEIYRINRRLPYDVPYPSVYLHPEKGHMVLCYPFDGYADIITSDGVIAATIEFFKGMKPNYERTMTCALGVSSAVFLTSDVERSRSLLAKYSLDGLPTWNIPLRYRFGFEVVLSSDEKLIAAGCYETLLEKVHRQTVIVSGNGTLLSELDILFRKAVFSPDNLTVVLTTRDKALAVETASAKILWTRSSSGDHSIISDVVGTHNSFVLQSSSVSISTDGEIRYTNPLFERFSWNLDALGTFTYTATYRHSKMVDKSDGVYFETDSTLIHLPF
jgi:hypothetical protein